MDDQQEEAAYYAERPKDPSPRDVITPFIIVFILATGTIILVGTCSYLWARYR